MKKQWIAILFAIFLPFLAWSQFAVTGIVTDSVSGEALPGAHIVLSNNFSAVVSDNNGRFSISGIKKGEYQLTTSYLGYLADIRTIIVNDNLNIRIQLHYSPLMQDEIIIRSTRAGEKTPATFQNISKTEIDKINTGVDIPFLLDQTPSVVTGSDAGAGIGYTSLRIRGSDLTRTNVMINGIPLNDAESHSVYFVDMPDFASSIDNLQIQRGVGTSVNGAGAFGASINFQTQNLHQSAYAEINNAVGSFNSFKHTVSFGSGLIDNKWTFDGRLSKISSDGFIDRASSDLRSYYFSGAYYSKKTILKFITFSGKEITYQAWTGIPSNIIDTNRTYNPMGEYYDANGNKKYYNNQVDDYQQTHYQLLLSHEINKSWGINAALHYTKGYGYYEEYQSQDKYSKYGLSNVYTTHDTITNTDLIRRKILDNDFYGYTFALTYENHKNISAVIGGAWNRYIGEHFGNIIWMQQYGNNPLNYEWYRNEGFKNDFNFYSKINYQMNKNWCIYADLQLRTIYYKIAGIDDDLSVLSQMHEFIFFNPKFGAYLQLNENSDLYLSFAIANREPSRSNFVDADPNKPFPVQETLQNFELGYSLKKSDFYFKSNLFWMDYKNQLVLTGEINDVGDPIMVNVPKSYRLGIEISAGAKILSNLKWEANLALSRNKIIDFAAYVDDWETGLQRKESLGTTNLSFSPEIIANNQFSYEIFKGFSANLISKYVGKQYVDNTSSENRKLKPYLLHNLRFNYTVNTRFIRQIESFFVINNLFDEKYETNAWVYRYYYNNKEEIMDGYFPQAGRNIMVGINFKF
ncbi:MAG: TonB-dependent receptor [Bacteroidetes bacterium]|nr:TonB-dependent receptor [Bacteroidota bacterium]